MPLVESIVERVRAASWRLLRRTPSPQSISLSVVRGGGLEIDLGGIAAGTTRTWRDSIGLAEAGVVLVFASVNVEHGTLPLASEPDTNVELTITLDGARIGRSLVTLRHGSAAVVTCTTSIRAAAGLRRVSATLQPFDASVKVGDHVLASLVVPETMSDLTIARP